MVHWVADPMHHILRANFNFFSNLFSIFSAKMGAKTEFRSSEPITDSERSQINSVRAMLQEKLPDGIPDDVNTDLNLCRWIRGYHGDTEKLVKNFATYLASRKAAGFVGNDFAEKFFELPSIAPFLQFIASSRLQDRQWSDEHNAFLFVERAWSQPKEVGVPALYLLPNARERL